MFNAIITTATITATADRGIVGMVDGDNSI